MRTTRAIAALLATLVLAGPALVSGQVQKAAEIEYPPLPAFEVAEPVRVELDNGLVLILVEDHELPLIDAVARIRAGQRLDPDGKTGLAALTGEVLRTGGTQTRTGDEIDEFLEGRAASIESSIGIDSGQISLSCLSEDFPEVLGLFADLLRHPAFDADKIAVAKNQANASIARQNDSPQSILFREFPEVLLGADSPYVQPDSYTSIAGITRADLEAFHGRYFHPNNIVVGVVGDFDAETMAVQIRQALGDWPAGPAAESFEGGYKKEPTPGVFYIEKNDVTQSSILIGHLGVRRDNPDYYAIEVFNEVLGGGFSSRLFTRVRSQQGLAYAVSGGVGSNWDRDGRFQLFTSTKTETTGAAIDALILEASNIVGSEPPTEAEIEKAKQVILSSFVFTSDSSRKILGQQLTYEFYGYPLDWLALYIDGIRAVTVDQVRRVGQQFVRPEDFTIMVVGPGEGRDRPLEDFGPVSIVDISIPELEVAGVVVTPEATARGRELLASAIAAHGGAEALASFETLRQKATATAITPNGEVEVGIDQIVVFPDRLRQAVTFPQGTMVQVLTPDEAFVQTPLGTQPLAGARRESFGEGLQRTLPVLLRAVLEGRVEAVSAGTAEAPGIEYVAIIHEGVSFRIGVEVESGRIAELIFHGTDFSGAPGEVRQVYDDFREVNGLTLPFSVNATFEGEPYLSSTISETLVNAPVDEGLFSPSE